MTAASGFWILAAAALKATVLLGVASLGPSDYAAHLLEISASLAAGRRLAGAGAALPMVQRSQLEGRVMSILTANPRRRGTALLVAAPVLMTADVEIAADGTVGRLEPGAGLVLETKWRGVEPRLRISAGDAGEPLYAWSVDGVERPYDEPARQWTKGVLAAFADLRELIHLRGRIGELRGEIGRLRGERGRLRGEIGRIRGERGRLQGEIGRVRGEQGRLRGDIGRLQGEAGRLRGEIGRIHGERGRLRGEIGRLRGQIAVLRQMDRLGDELSAEELARRDDRLEAKETEIREIESQIDALDVAGRVADFERQIEALDVDGRRAEIEGRIDAEETEGRIADIEKEIDALDVEGKVAGIEKEIDALEVERHTAEIERQIDGLEQQLAPAESKLQEAYDEVKRLTSQVE